jgi:hypothetical protein
MWKNLDIPHPLTPSPIFGRGETDIILVTRIPKMGEGLGVREKI